MFRGVVVLPCSSTPSLLRGTPPNLRGELQGGDVQVMVLRSAIHCPGQGTWRLWRDEPARGDTRQDTRDSGPTGDARWRFGRDSRCSPIPTTCRAGLEVRPPVVRRAGVARPDGGTGMRFFSLPYL